MKAIVIQWRIQSIIIMALLFMWLMPYGTFDPTKFGFYLSIFLACVLEFVNAKLLKFPKKSES
jgi:hypothetical protein